METNKSFWKGQRFHCVSVYLHLLTVHSSDNSVSLLDSSPAVLHLWHRNMPSVCGPGTCLQLPRARFQVLTNVAMKSDASWDMTPYSMVRYLPTFRRNLLPRNSVFNIGYGRSTVLNVCNCVHQYAASYSRRQLSYSSWLRVSVIPSFLPGKCLNSVLSRLLPLPSG